MIMTDNYYQINPIMKKNIGVESKEGVLTFHFLNGSISLNEAEYGAYAICPGCGAGKTTAIKDLIAHKWNEGVLYSAFTRNEVNEMYQFIVNNLVGKCMSPYGEILSKNDIIVLHSDYEAEGTDKNLWFENPEEVMNKKVILCTHAKLLDEPLEVLISTKFQRISYISKKSRILTGDDTHIRNWILIDEGIDIKPVSSTITREGMMSLGKLTKTIRVTEIDPITGFPIGKTKQLKDWAVVRNFTLFTEFNEMTRALAFEAKIKSFKNLLKPETSKLNILRNEQIIDEMFDNYEDYMNTDNDIIKLTYGLASWSLEGMKTHLLLFDGTSDITLSISRKFKLLTYNNKYNSQVSAQIFPFSLDRRVKPINGIVDIDSYLRDKLNAHIDNLASIIQNNNKTLIFCWKNFKSDNSEVNDDSVSSGLIAENKEVTMTCINSNLDLSQYITTGLIKKGINRDKFSVEYYGSGKDKAVNDYRDYDGVVLFGKYSVPNTVISDFNIAYHSGITGTEYYANRVIQAICRSRIRKHEALPINVYFSSDWSSDVINYVTSYFNTGISKTVIVNARILEDRITALKSKGITPARSEKIARLSMIDSGIFYSIMNNVYYKTEFKLDEIFGVLPMSRKDTDKYISIINMLNKYGVSLYLIP